MDRPNPAFDTIVLGAGPAGIGAALGLGQRAVVLERATEPAGLSRTIDLDGVTFDLGGHSFHTPHDPVRRLVFDALPMEQQRREAWCLVGGSWIPYPFQKHFSELPDEATRAACARGLAEARDWNTASDFDAYLDLRFGPGIAQTFMRPYNAKLWGKNLARMAVDWTSERIAAPKGIEQRFDRTSGIRSPLQADTDIAYPARGGFGEIFRALSRRISDLRLGQRVARIDPVARTLRTDTGDILRWKQIVSTLALPDLLATLPNVPAEIAAAVAMLEALPVSLVMVVLEGQGRLDRQRVYCADGELPGHKTVFNNTSSTWLRQQARHGILLEVAGDQPHDVDELAQRGVNGLLKTALVDRASDVRRVEVITLPLGYPVPTHSRASVIRKAREWLAGQDITIVGRFAEWAYINSDEALARGLTVGEALVGTR